VRKEIEILFEDKELEILFEEWLECSDDITFSEFLGMANKDLCKNVEDE